MNEDDVKLLWKACQIPDFRKISNQDHANLIMKIFNFIRTKGFIPSDWLAMEIDRLDNIQGDIDVLSKRLSFIRTWSFVANINKWLLDSDYFIGIARNVEDKLSDALHLKLTQRFVDLRRSVLIKTGMVENFDKNDFEKICYFKEDIKFIKEAGFKAYRFSFSWPRILPSDHNTINTEGLDFYSRLLDEILKNGKL